MYSDQLNSAIMCISEQVFSYFVENFDMRSEADLLLIAMQHSPSTLLTQYLRNSRWKGRGRVSKGHLLITDKSVKRCVYPLETTKEFIVASDQ